MKKIVIIGDSIAAGLYEGQPSPILDNFISDELTGMGFPGYEMVNLGKRAEGTTEVLARIADAVNEEPDFVVINAGINDALNQKGIEAFSDNLSEMIEKFAAEKVILMGLGIVDQKKHPEADSEVIQTYNEQAKKIAVSAGINFIDMYHHEMVYPVPLEFISEDGLHPSKFGYHLYGGLIARDIKNKLIG